MSTKSSCILKQTFMYDLFVDDRRYSTNHWDKVFKNGPSKICARQPLKNVKWFGVLTAQKMKFSVWLHLLKKSLMENFIFGAMVWTDYY